MTNSSVSRWPSAAHSVGEPTPSNTSVPQAQPAVRSSYSAGATAANGLEWPSELTRRDSRCRGVQGRQHVATPQYCLALLEPLARISAGGVHRRLARPHTPGGVLRK